MAKPFRKLEIEFNGSRYVIGKSGAEMFLAFMDTFDLPEHKTFITLREDLRAALAAPEGEPEAAPENPFSDETEEPPVPWEAPKTTLKNVAKENEESCGDCRIPKCRFCDMPGTRAGGRKDGAGRTVERYYICKTAGCLAAKMATPQPMSLFSGGK